ncbi:hypothetical protein FACS1894172_02600 [Spirochaetia bacterium]|nr:hypothetical protein FACS1894164_08460 [Spirochaetia bacterium]GHU30092.1 hypothetical protein FACS1894172_02600 [Spirochaetia bacterium]
MLKELIRYAIVGCVILCSACASSGTQNYPANSTDPEAEASAMDALARMDNGGSVNRPQSPSNPGRVPEPTKVVDSKTPPAWINASQAVYSEANFVSAVGSGRTRADAEKDAIFKVAGFFGQSVQGEISMVSRYSQAVTNGVVTGISNDSTREAITISAQMDSLVGTEVRELWFDSKNTYYAVAVMEKSRAGAIYSDMITSNIRILDTLSNLSPAERVSLDGYAKYQVAAVIADANQIFMKILNLLGSRYNSTRHTMASLKTGAEYRLAAQAIVASIPIGVQVAGPDQSNRIKSAFEKALGDQGFRSGGINSRYVLRVSVQLSEVAYPSGTNKYARIELNSQLTDTTTNATLFPYTFNDREGHVTLSEAENRAIREAERNIQTEYGNALQQYFSNVVLR